MSALAPRLFSEGKPPANGRNGYTSKNPHHRSRRCRQRHAPGSRGHFRAQGRAEKRERRRAGFDERIVGLYARGMIYTAATREDQGQVVSALPDARRLGVSGTVLVPHLHGAYVAVQDTVVVGGITIKRQCVVVVR